MRARTFDGKIFQSKRPFQDDFKVSKGLIAKREDESVNLVTRIKKGIMETQRNPNVGQGDQPGGGQEGGGQQGGGGGQERDRDKEREREKEGGGGEQGGGREQGGGQEGGGQQSGR